MREDQVAALRIRCAASGVDADELIARCSRVGMDENKVLDAAAVAESECRKLIEASGNRDQATPPQK